MNARLVAGSAFIALSLLAADTPRVASASPEQVWNDLAAGNARFVAGKPRPHDLAAERAKLANSQSPRVAVLGCADSRVGPELILDQTLGDLFVVRTAGNSPDPMAIGSLEYAVEHLGTTVIVVMGHQKCGAVTAACSGEKMPSPNLAAVVAPIQVSCTAASGKIESASRDHVHRTAVALLSQSSILKQHVDDKKLTIVESYYSLDSGKVERLK